MKRSALIIPILTGAVLAPVAPAVAVAAPAPVSQSAARLSLIHISEPTRPY